IAEGNETVLVTLTGPTNATIADGEGIGTILDDDDAPTIAIADASVVEGTGGTTVLTFVVTLSAASGAAVTVDYATADGSAVAPADYTSAVGTLTFAPGATSATIEVAINPDDLSEPTESFAVLLSDA